MIGPTLKNTPQVGPVRPDAVEHTAIQSQQDEQADSRVKVDNAVGGAIGSSDDLEVARGETASPVQAALSLTASRLNIDRDEKTGNVIYKFVDRVTGEIVKQMPAEELIEQAQRLAANREGLFFDETA